MFLENFIMRYVRLEAGFSSILKMEANCISFRSNNEAFVCLKNLEDLLNTLLDETNGKFVFSVNFKDNCLDFKYIEGEC